LLLEWLLLLIRDGPQAERLMLLLMAGPLLQIDEELMQLVMLWLLLLQIWLHLWLVRPLLLQLLMMLLQAWLHLRQAGLLLILLLGQGWPWADSEVSFFRPSLPPSAPHGHAFVRWLGT
jgi:hypothetical protein